MAVDLILAKEVDRSIITLTKIENPKILVNHLKRHLEKHIEELIRISLKN